MPEEKVYCSMYSRNAELYHHGIKGQKWGVTNGPPYPLDRGRNVKIFISGSSKTEDPSGQYYRKELPIEVKKQINNGIKLNNTFIVGDAPGIDTQVQKYLNNKQYKNVIVYCTGDSPRANFGNWQIKKIDGKGYEPMSKEWLALKDKQMQNDATKGIAIVLENGGASATRKNVEALIKQNKNIKVYELSSNKNLDKWIENL